MPHVLIVDDQPAMRFVLTEVLGEAGFSVAALGDGRAVLEYLATRPPVDVFLIDRFLPGMNGLELLGSIRAVESYARTPAVLVTGAPLRPGDAEGGAFAAVLQKPFQLPGLLAVLREIVSAVALAAPAQT